MGCNILKNIEKIVFLSGLLLLFMMGKSLANEADHKLLHFLEAEWNWELNTYPESASWKGFHVNNAAWDPHSLDDYKKINQHYQNALIQLKAISREHLSEDQQINYDLFEHKLLSAIQSYDLKQYLMPLSHSSGVQTKHQIAEYLDFTQVSDYEDWLKRLAALDDYIDEEIALLKAGIQHKMLPSQSVVKRIPQQIKSQLVEEAENSFFYQPFINMPDEIEAAHKQALREKAREIIQQEIIPAYQKLLVFIEDIYLPQCRKSDGVWDLPNGEAYYKNEIHYYTGTDLTANEIHELGLKEVARITEEMEGIKTSVNFNGTLQAFFHFLRTDPQFYYTDPEDLYQAYLATTKKIDPALVKLFGKLPRIPYGVLPIPAEIAPDVTTAYYSRPAADGSRAGYYYVNLYKPTSRPKYEIEVLSAHEAVPGHHLQIALAQELENLPNFRRYSDGDYTAFIEGWALYSESLGEALGLYQDPYAKFGQLTYEIWRAIRLVVDTGIHAKKWTRQEAINYFMNHAGKTEHDIINEIDRYIAWPGQALAYKIGELKIKELKATSQKALGDKFDIREFHDAILVQGAIPLAILEKYIQQYIAEASQK